MATLINIGISTVLISLIIVVDVCLISMTMIVIMLHLGRHAVSS
jgi:hypothetical protein